MSEATNHETMQAITDYIEDNGVPPSVRELGRILGLSSSASVHKRLNALKEAGLIDKVGPRALILVKGETE